MVGEPPGLSRRDKPAGSRWGVPQIPPLRKPGYLLAFLFFSMILRISSSSFFFSSSVGGLLGFSVGPQALKPATHKARTTIKHAENFMECTSRREKRNRNGTFLILCRVNYPNRRAWKRCPRETGPYSSWSGKPRQTGSGRCRPSWKSPCRRCGLTISGIDFG
jgi:hypothetical protein